MRYYLLGFGDKLLGIGIRRQILGIEDFQSTTMEHLQWHYLPYKNQSVIAKLT